MVPKLRTSAPGSRRVQKRQKYFGQKCFITLAGRCFNLWSEKSSIECDSLVSVSLQQMCAELTLKMELQKCQRSISSDVTKVVRTKISQLGVSHGLVVMEGDPCSRGHEFESKHWIQTDYVIFHTWGFVVKLNWYLEWPNKRTFYSYL